jgi:hypothetical protein
MRRGSPAAATGGDGFTASLVYPGDVVGARPRSALSPCSLAGVRGFPGGAPGANMRPRA